MLKKFSIIVFILISITLIFMSTQKKLVPQIDMLTISGETISTKDLKGSVYLLTSGQRIAQVVLKKCQA